MKKFLFLFMTIILICTGCNYSKKVGKKNVENSSINNKSEKFSYIPKDGYESAKVMEINVSDSLIFISVGWGKESNGNAFIEYFESEKGEWKSKKKMFLENSTQYEPKSFKLIQVDKSTKLLTILNKDISRGYVGAVTYYLIKDNQEIKHIKNIDNNGFLSENIQVLGSNEINYLKENNYIDRNSSNKAIFTKWSDLGIVFGYDTETKKEFIEKIKDKKILSDIHFGETEYLGIYLKDSGDGISSLIGKFEDRTLNEVTNLDKITVIEGSNLVFMNDPNTLTIYSDLDQPGLFYNDFSSLSYSNMLKESMIEDMKPGIYTFVIENSSLNNYYAFEIHVK